MSDKYEIIKPNKKKQDDELQLSFWYWPSQALLDACAKLEGDSSAVVLDTTDFSLDSNSCKVLARSLWRIRTLQEVRLISNWHQWFDFKPLLRFDSLTTLEVKSLILDDDFVRIVETNAKHLTKLCLTECTAATETKTASCVFWKILSAFNQEPDKENQLCELSLQRCRGISDGCAAILSCMLKSPTTVLHTLELKWSYIGDSGITLIANALQKNTTLQTLNLEEINWYNGNVNEKGIAALGNALKVNNTLQNLFFFATAQLSVAPNGYQSFLDALTINTSICSFGPEPNWRALPQTAFGAMNAEALKHVYFLCLCNASKDYDIKTSFQDQSTADTIEMLTTIGCPAKSCAKCNTSISVSKEGLQCKSASQHWVCTPCVERSLTTHLGESELPCPICQASWMISEDLYGKVSAFHYQMHCKELYRDGADTKAAVLPTNGETV